MIINKQKRKPTRAEIIIKRNSLKFNNRKVNTRLYKNHIVGFMKQKTDSHYYCASISNTRQCVDKL